MRAAIYCILLALGVRQLWLAAGGRRHSCRLPVYFVAHSPEAAKHVAHSDAVGSALELRAASWREELSGCERVLGTLQETRRLSANTQVEPRNVQHGLMHNLEDRVDLSIAMR